MASPSPVPSLSVDGAAPEPVEGPLALLGRHPWSLVGDVELDPALGLPDGQLDPAADGGDVEGVGEQVVQHLLHGARGRPHGDGRARLDGERDVLFGGQGRPGRLAVGRHRGQVDDLSAGGGGLGAGQGEQAVDQSGQPAGLGGGRPQVTGGRRRRRRLQVLQPQPQRGQGGAQLVGGVGDERLLGRPAAGPAGPPCR